MSICHTRVFVLHDSDDDTGPVLLIVVLLLGLDKRLFMVIHWLICRIAAFGSDQVVKDHLRNEIWTIWVVLFAELNDVPHLFRLPVSELTTQFRGLVEIWNKVGISFFLIEFFLLSSIFFCFLLQVISMHLDINLL